MQKKELFWCSCAWYLNDFGLTKWMVFDQQFQFEEIEKKKLAINSDIQID